MEKDVFFGINKNTIKHQEPDIHMVMTQGIVLA